MAKSWWIWGVGVLALVVLGGPILGALMGVIGLVLGTIVAVMKAGIGLVFSLVGLVLGTLLNLLVLGGLGYLGYRWWRRRETLPTETPQAGWPDARGSHE